MKIKEEMAKMMERINAWHEKDDLYTITTCDDDRWDRGAHFAMQRLQAVGIEGCVIQGKYKFECWDWTVLKVD